MEIVILIFIIFVVAVIIESNKRSQMAPEERKIYEDRLKWGPLNPALICPHCQTKGQIHTKSVNRKKGVSGAKATGALLTGGISLLATGLSRKEGATQAHCSNCDSTWDF
jgi:hypothetical protein